MAINPALEEERGLEPASRSHLASSTPEGSTAAQSPERPVIGFVGLGRMGLPMAHHLLAAGHRLLVHDLRREPVEELCAAGAQAAEMAEIAATTGISLTMLLNDDVLRSVVLGPDGLLAAAPAGHLLCDLSTISPALSVEIAAVARERGVRYVRGSVVGSVQPAKDGALAVFLSGAASDVEHVRPVLVPLAASIRHVGVAEEAVYLKLVHSTVVGVYSAMVSEALALGQRGGLDLRELVDILESGPLGSRQLTLKAPVLISRDFTDPPSDINTAAKDVDLVLGAARELAVPMPVASAVRQVMAFQQARGGGRRDIWSMLEAFEELAGGVGTETTTVGRR